MIIHHGDAEARRKKLKLWVGMEIAEQVEPTERKKEIGFLCVSVSPW
jgi:hypothetical protein